MATKLDKYLETNDSAIMMERWNKGGETRETLIKEVGYSNDGALYNALRDDGYLPGGPVNTGNAGNGGTKSKKPKGFLPKRVENWCIGKLGLDVAEGDLLPEGFGPSDFLALEDVAQETVNYQRLLSKLCLEKEVPALRAWLGCGLTRAYREAEKAEKLSKGAGAKVGKALKTALNHAEALESPEIALEIAALMARFGFQTETETEE